MSNLTLPWNGFWSSFKSQSGEMKRQWITDISPDLNYFKTYATQSVLDEVFGTAPIEVQRYFGYNQRQVESNQVNNQSDFTKRVLRLRSLLE